MNEWVDNNFNKIFLYRSEVYIPPFSILKAQFDKIHISHRKCISRINYYTLYPWYYQVLRCLCIDDPLFCMIYLNTLNHSFSYFIYFSSESDDIIGSYDHIVIVLGFILFFDWSWCTFFLASFLFCVSHRSMLRINDV